MYTQRSTENCGLFYDITAMCSVIALCQIVLLLPCMASVEITIGYMGLPHFVGEDGSHHPSAGTIDLTIHDFKATGSLANVRFR